MRCFRIRRKDLKFFRRLCQKLWFWECRKNPKKGDFKPILVDFGQFFSLIKKINYSYDLIIQGAREDLIDTSILPEETCSKYFKFVMQYLDK